MTRLWLIFFVDDGTAGWWAPFLRRGYRHVCAASFYASEERWVYFNPARPGSVIELADREGFQARYEDLMRRSTAVLRFRSHHERRSMPATAYCVGAVKSLLGVRCWAVTPYGLMRALLRRDAEVVEVPIGEPACRQPTADDGAGPAPAPAA